MSDFGDGPLDDLMDNPRKHRWIMTWFALAGCCMCAALVCLTLDAFKWSDRMLAAAAICGANGFSGIALLALRWLWKEPES